MTNKLHKYFFLMLCSPCLLMGNVAFATAKASDTHASNEAIANAYKSAIDQFINELKLRVNEGTKTTGTFMGSFENYRSEVRKDDEGFCIVFSPRDFEGGPVFGGSISYCFDDTGTALKRVSKNR
ncbi:hypothetical protein [Pseudoxanthomonas sacheonensis]|uniref:Uncharacterized protein n=1 Tax=Pseudoxanthomonas sacheonensis TaxID=443615 RepID=A0ABU1RRY1_9GAMM|nr:hypothetical protein [Pseudoxanthomonas sacheonensis]MDR6841541.1 hypothetical protein [Pseudoxanthomonas sacheonensis]